MPKSYEPPLSALSAFRGIGIQYDESVAPVRQCGVVSFATGDTPNDRQSSLPRHSPGIDDQENSHQDDRDEDEMAAYNDMFSEDPHYTYYRGIETNPPPHKRYTNPSEISAKPTIFAALFVLGVNMVLFLVWLTNDEFTMSGALVLEWMILFDSSVLLFVCVYLVVMIVDWSLVQIHDSIAHPLIQFMLLRWHMYQYVAIGLLWGTACGVGWKTSRSMDYDVHMSERMDQIIRDVVLSTLLISGLLAFKVTIISFYETKLYQKFRHLIALSLREEQVLKEVEARMFTDREDRLVTKKFNEVALINYLSRSAFQAPPSHRITELPEHIPVSKAANNLGKELVSRFGGKDGKICEADFLSMAKSKSVSYFSEIFSYFDIQRRGSIDLECFNNAIGHMMDMRKNIQAKMKSRRLRLEVTDKTLDLIILLVALFVILIAILEVDLSPYLIPIFTVILGLSFAYQELLADLFDNLYSIYFVRPCEIGDVVQVGDTQYFVEEVGLLSTLLISLEGHPVYLRNTLMRQTPLRNLRRGQTVRILVQIPILSTTSLASIRDLRHQMQFFASRTQLLSKKVACFVEKEMRPCPILVVEGKVKGFANWHQWDKWLDVHNNFVLTVSNRCRELGIIDSRNRIKVKSRTHNPSP